MRSSTTSLDAPVGRSVARPPEDVICLCCVHVYCGFGHIGHVANATRNAYEKSNDLEHGKFILPWNNLPIKPCMSYLRLQRPRLLLLKVERERDWVGELLSGGFAVVFHAGGAWFGGISTQHENASRIRRIQYRKPYTVNWSRVIIIFPPKQRANNRNHNAHTTQARKQAKAMQSFETHCCERNNNSGLAKKPVS